MTTRKTLSVLLLVLTVALFSSSAFALEPGDVDDGDHPLFTLLGEKKNVADPPSDAPAEAATASTDDAIKAAVVAEAPSLVAISPLAGETPFAELTDQQIAKLLKADAAALGSMSVGFTNSGALVNGAQLEADPRWVIVNPAETWGTTETLGFVRTIIGKVHEAYPKNTSPLYIGDISNPGGGRLNRHASHQAGRDIDLGFFFKGGQGVWYTVGGAGNLDLPRNWAFVRAMLVHTDVELILVDSKIQKLLYAYALKIGEDRAWLDSVFQYPNGRGGTIIRHARRHHTHYHVRFYNREAQELGRRAYPVLLAQKKIKPPMSYSYHKVRSGQTLGHLARTYGTSVRAIMQANGLRGTNIRAGRAYRIPRKGGVHRVPGHISVPQRKVPPSAPTCLAHVVWTPAGSGAPTIRRPLTYAENAQGRKVAFVQLAAAEPTVASDVVAKAEAAAVAVTAPVRKRASSSSIRYRVRSGDNLWSIARHHGVSVSDLKRWNGLRSNKLKPGQRLTIYKKHRRG